MEFYYTLQFYYDQGAYVAQAHTKYVLFMVKIRYRRDGSKMASSSMERSGTIVMKDAPRNDRTIT